MKKVKPTIDLKQLEILAPREIVYRRGISPYENPNRTVANKGLRYLQDHVETDTHYRSVLGTRLAHLLMKGYKILPAYSHVKGRLVVSEQDRAIADFVSYCLGNMNGSFEADMMAMMTHISRGFSLSEMNYRYFEGGKHAGKVGFESIRFKEQEYFSFEHDDYGRYKIVQIDPERKVLNNQKFVHLINGLNDENPYGEPVAALCAFWVWLKENGAKYWSVFLERFGQPLTLVETPENLGTEQQGHVDRIIDDLESATALQVPKNMVIKFLEAQRSGEASYRGYLDVCNSEMSKVMLGSTLAVESQKSSSGTHALGGVHADTMGIQFGFDVITSQSAINRNIIKPLIDYNFPGIEYYPKFRWMAINTSEFISFAQGVEAMARTGVNIPAKWVHEVSGIPVADELEQVLQAPVTVHPVNGVDNKAKHSRGREEEGLDSRLDHPTRQQVGVRVPQRGNDIEGLNGLWGATACARTKQRWFNAAKREGAINESIVQEAKVELKKRWQKFADKVANKAVFDFQMLRDFEEKELSGIYYQLMMISSLRGRMTAKDEAEADVENGNEEQYGTGAGFPPPRERQGRERERQWGIGRISVRPYRVSYAFYYKPFAELLRDLKRKKVISSDEYKLLSEEMKDLSFTVAREQSLYVMEKIKDEIEQVLLGKNSLPDFYDQVIDLFVGAGVLGAAAHLETVLRTNLQSLYNKQRMRTFAELDNDEFPQLCIEVIDDDRIRDSHRTLAGYTMPKGDPVWGWLYPPFEYNCRCTIRAVHKSESRDNSGWYPVKTDYEFCSGR